MTTSLVDLKKALDCKSSAKRVLEIERDAIHELLERIGPEFEQAVQFILKCRGRVIVTGIGKSGIIGKKIVASLNSTGTPAIFLHPAEGVHGDLGMVLKDDIILCLSKSGSTGEISRLIPIFKTIGVPILTMTGNLRSALAERSDIVLDVSVKEEACPNDLAPTASTTAMLAMGDALTVALLEQRDFKKEDFAFFHPGGSLGKTLVKIDEIMFRDDKIALVTTNTQLHDVILEITKKRFGGTCVVDDTKRLVGIITDGDLRRLLPLKVDLEKMSAGDIMNAHPKTVQSGSLAKAAFQLMENHNIMQVVIVDEEHIPVGMIHLHDLLEAGFGSM